MKDQEPAVISRRSVGALSLIGAALVGEAKRAEASTSISVSVSGGIPESMWREASSRASSSNDGAMASKVYTEVFVAALTRFLVNFDSSIRAWWVSQATLVPKNLSSENTKAVRSSQLNGLSASVVIGLSRFTGKDGADSLFRGLLNSYGASSEAARQLCLVFALLANEDQPTTLMNEQLPLFDSSYEKDKDVSPESSKSTLERAVVFPEDRSLLALPPKPSLRKLPDGSFRGTTSFDFSFGGASKRPAPVSREKTLDASNFALFFVAGAGASGLAHSALTPLDMLKTRLQTQPEKYSDGPVGAVSTILEEEGAGAFIQGIGPTAAGYFLGGAIAFGGTEMLKRASVAVLGPQFVLENSFLTVLACGAAAISVCTCFVAPFEATRIRSVQEPTFASSFPEGLLKVLAEGNVYNGLPALLIKEVPFHATKFAVFDSVSSFIQASAPFSSSTNPATGTVVSVLSGLVAGVVAAVISQPADATFTRCNKAGSELPPVEAFADLFETGSLLVGLSSRCVFAGILVALQFTIYDIFKTSLHVAPKDLTLFLDALSGLPSPV